MAKKMRELSREELKLVSGGSGYLIASGRTSETRSDSTTGSRSGI